MNSRHTLVTSWCGQRHWAMVTSFIWSQDMMTVSTSTTDSATSVWWSRPEWTKVDIRSATFIYHNLGWCRRPMIPCKSTLMSPSYQATHKRNHVQHTMHWMHLSKIFISYCLHQKTPACNRLLTIKTCWQNVQLIVVLGTVPPGGVVFSTFTVSAVWLKDILPVSCLWHLPCSVLWSDWRQNAEESWLLTL